MSKRDDVAYADYVSRDLSELSMIDDLTYASYKHNRDSEPFIEPQRWERVYTQAKAMEARYQSELRAGKVAA